MKRADKPLKQATPYNVQLSITESPGRTHVEDLGQESADKASELLMLNHAKYHTLFNEVGLHNHIVHHLCSLWALGASPAEIQAAYDLNKWYQLPHYHQGPSMAAKMKDDAFFKSCLGDSDHYTNFLHFFQDEITQRGVPDVLNEYLFAGTEQADNLLGRMYSGFEHPILHLGFGLEFNQPLLIAESLASACIHDYWPLPILLPIEQNLKAHPTTPITSLHSVIQALHTDPSIAAAASKGNVPNRVTDALLANLPPSLIPILSHWRVLPTEQDIAHRTAEMTHICTYLSGASQHPRKKPSIEFFMMHSTNLSIFYPTFMQQDWLSLQAKARLLTWKGWMDAVMYAACACPTLYPERIRLYTPEKAGGWDTIVKRATSYPDDGHTVKLIRALLNAEHVSRPYAGNPEFPLRHGDYLKIAHMAMDSVERMLQPGYRLPEMTRKLYVTHLGVDEEVVKIVVRFVRWCGIESSWKDFPDLEDDGKKAKL